MECTAQRRNGMPHQDRSDTLWREKVGCKTCMYCMQEDGGRRMEAAPE